MPSLRSGCFTIFQIVFILVTMPLSLRSGCFVERFFKSFLFSLSCPCQGKVLNELKIRSTSLPVKFQIVFSLRSGCFVERFFKSFSFSLPCPCPGTVLNDERIENSFYAPASQLFNFNFTMKYSQYNLFLIQGVNIFLSFSDFKV